MAEPGSDGAVVAVMIDRATRSDPTRPVARQHVRVDVMQCGIHLRRVKLWVVWG